MRLVWKSHKKKKIEGVISNSEPVMVNVAKIAQEMHLVGNKITGIKILNSKHEFREFQHKHNLFAPKSFESDTFEDFKKKCLNLHFPIIVKPSLSSGSRGTTILYGYNEKELENCFLACKRFSVNDNAVVEEFVNMPGIYNIGGDVFIHNNKFIWDGLATCVRYQNLPCVPGAEMWPSNLDGATLSYTKKELEQIFNSAGITHGQYNIEGYMTEEGRLFIIEINVRQGGNEIPDLIKDHTDIDMYKLLVTTCMGDDDYFNAVVNKKLVLKPIVNFIVFSDKNGHFSGLEYDKSLNGKIYKKIFFVSMGDQVRKAKNATDALGFIRLKFNNIEEQYSFVPNLKNLIRVNVVP